MAIIKIIRVKPLCKPEIIEIEHTLENLQKEVGGYIEFVYPFSEKVGLICNEEGKLQHLPLNRTLKCDDEIYDILAGNFLVVGLTDDDICSLTDSQIEKYKEYYNNVQSFEYTKDGIIVTEYI